MAKDPSFNWALERKKARASLSGGLTQSELNYGSGWQGNRKSKRRAAARKSGGRGMSLAQLDKASAGTLEPWVRDTVERKFPDKYMQGYRRGPVDAPWDDFTPKQRLSAATKGTRGRMANKLLKGGGNIRLPQIPKGGMKALLPLLLLALLAGGMGMVGNEDLDGMLG